MAVKLMLAPAIAKGELERTVPTVKRRDGAPAKAKRRRSSVYDAEGNEVFITLMCLKCHRMRPLAQFGLRKMADGAIRNQPWCRPCRSGAGERPRRQGSSDATAPPPQAAPAADAARGAEAPRRTGSVAAEVAAALAAGLRR